MTDLLKDEDEAYWFIRWVTMRAERNKLRGLLEKSKGLDMVKLQKENEGLRASMKKVREEFQPLKTKIHRNKKK